MRTLSIHPIEYLRAHHPVEYLRVHLDYEGIWTKLLTSLQSLLKKVFKSAKKIVVAVMVLLIASFFVFLFIQLVEYYAATAHFYDAITSMVFPYLEPLPMWM
jgi:hypothetical protein